MDTHLIFISIHDDKECPFDQTSIKINTVTKNAFIAQVNKCVRKASIALNRNNKEDNTDALIGQLFALIVCPRSGTILKSPVFAPCGETFEISQIRDGACCRTHYSPLDPQIPNTAAQSVVDVLRLYFWDKGYTLFHLAANNCDRRLAEQLLKNRMVYPEDICWKNVDEYTPFEFAINSGERQVRQLLGNNIKPCSTIFSFGMPIIPFEDTFQHRPVELKALHELIEKKMKRGMDKVVITGLGGVGKSVLAMQYILEYGRDYTHVIVIDACHHDNLVKSFLNLADQLDISCLINGEKRDITFIVEDIYKKLSGHKALLILDGAKEWRGEDGIYDCFLPRFLEKGKNSPRIIITSRKALGYIPEFNSYRFTDKNAIKFLTSSLDKNNEEREEKIVELADTLGYFPLGLKQAVEYMRVHGLGIDDYLEEYKKDPKKVLGFEFGKYSNNNYRHTVLTVWQTTIDEISKFKIGDQTLELMKIIAYFTPETKIPVKFIESALKLPTEALSKLIEDFIVRPRELTVNRLAQQLLRLKYKDKEEEILNKVLQLFEGEIEHFIDHALSI